MSDTTTLRPIAVLVATLATGAALAAEPARAGFGGEDGKIVFASTRGGNTDIYVIDGDGSNELRLTTAAASETQPAWSPGANRIAYVRDGDVWIMSADGSGQTNLTNSAAADAAPDWSRDGSRVVFTPAPQPPAAAAPQQPSAGSRPAVSKARPKLKSSPNGKKAPKKKAPTKKPSRKR